MGYGYGRGIYFGHASIYLRESLIKALKEWRAGNIKHWSAFFGSKDLARVHVGRLWHCTDVLPGDIRELASRAFELKYPVRSYAQLARVLLTDLKKSVQ